MTYRTLDSTEAGGCDADDIGGSITKREKV
jgi:hypothetical protein